MKNLRVETFVLGMISTNCYLAVNEMTREAVLIDPADEAGRIADRIEHLGARLRAVLLTHGHFDHIGAVEAVRRRFGVSVYALDAEQEILEDPEKNLSALYGRGFTVTPDGLLKDGEELELAGLKFRVLHTPGHTVGGACYYLPEEGVLFSGDTLFCGSVGRTDFPTGSMGRLHESIHTKLFVLPEDTAVYPGHGGETSIGYEKEYNPY